MASHFYSTSFRENYGQFGVDNYYDNYGANYRNPHEAKLKRALLQMLAKWKGALALGKVMDLACGSGEVALVLKEWDAKQRQSSGGDGCELELIGCDPYTYAAYEERLGCPALRHSFQDIADGVLYDEGEYDTIFCCYAMHLVEKDRLYALCQGLAQVAVYLVIVTPHKRPDIQESMGWALEDELVIDKVRMRRYRSVYK